MRILIVDDEESTRQRMVEMVEGLGYETAGAESGATALELNERAHFDVVLLDWRVNGTTGGGLLLELAERNPHLKTVVMASPESIETAAKGMPWGTVDFLLKPFIAEQIRQVLKNLSRLHQFSRCICELDSRLSSVSIPCDWTTEDAGMAEFMEQAWEAAATSFPLLIRGESGAGKTLLAGVLHENSPQKENPFCRVNCQNVSADLLENELFGQGNGSWAGTDGQAWGKVARAEGGTLFLDEIGELPMDFQAKLLRLVQDKEYQRAGEGKARKAKVRVIAASDRPLEQAIQSGHFREDLFALLNAVPLRLPPLRSRMGDMPRLAVHHLRFLALQCGKQISSFAPEAMQAMQRYAWPGNLRELRNTVEQAVILAGGEQIQVAELPDRIKQPDKSTEGRDLQVGSKVSLEELESEHIRKLIQQTSTMEEAARILGIDPATLYRKRKKWAQQKSADSAKISSVGPG